MQLYVFRCFDVTDVAFKSLYSEGLCQNLRALYLDGCCKITDNTVIQVKSDRTVLKLKLFFYFFYFLPYTM